jgi:hypothetical protein
MEGSGQRNSKKRSMTDDDTFALLINGYCFTHDEVSHFVTDDKTHSIEQSSWWLSRGLHDYPDLRVVYDLDNDNIFIGNDLTRNHGHIRGSPSSVIELDPVSFRKEIPAVLSNFFGSTKVPGIYLIKIKWSHGTRLCGVLSPHS